MSIKTAFSIFWESHNSFDGKREGETVIFVLRRHPFFVLIQTAFSVILSFAPLLIGGIYIDAIVLSNLGALALFLYSLWCLLLWQGIFYSIAMYTLDVWIVTDQRIIDSTQGGYFNRTVSELNLSRIQDISTKINGLIPTFFKFGNLEIQTAGAEEKFKFIQIPNPEEVKSQIMNHISRTAINT